MESTMRKIKLTRGKFALVDDADYHWLSQIKWRYTTNGYASGILFGGTKTGKTVLMHRLIMLAPDTMTVDHKNHDTLDNRRKNLRHATQTQQNANRIKTFGASIYKGVYRRSDGLKWMAQIGKDRKKRSMGCFESEEDAARCYNAMADFLFGEHALLNDVSPRFPSKELIGAYINRWCMQSRYRHKVRRPLGSTATAGALDE